MKRCYKFGIALIIAILVGMLIPGSSVLAAPDDEVMIPDPGLRAAIAAEIGDTSFTEADLSTLIDLEAPFLNISDLSGLEFCTGLRYLYLGGNQISDISVLSGLAELRELDLSGNNVTDISALSGLTKLQGVDLSSNNVAVISVLSAFNDLVYLDLSGNTISDILPLSGLTNLIYLYLGGNTISDVSALSGLTGLQEIALGHNNVSNIFPLAGLTGLRNLSLGFNDISDISVLLGLVYLQELDLTNNNIEDISALSGLGYLRNLYLGANEITTILPLVNNTGLGFGDFVDLRDNPLDDISVLTCIPELESRLVNVYFDASSPDNQPPEADAGGPYEVDEGAELTLDGSGSSDPDENIELYEWDLDNDGEYDDATGETVTVVFDDNGEFTVGLKVTDAYDETDIDTAIITVVNQPPDIVVESDLVVNLGDPVTVSAAFTDPGILDTHTTDIDWGDGSIEPADMSETEVSGNVTGSHVYAWPGTYEVTVTVTDDDLGVGSYIFSVEVLPVADVMIETIADVIDDMGLSGGKNESIGASLDAAVKALEDSNPRNDGVAVNTLEAFINKIEAWRGNKISEEDADVLIAWALETIAALNEG